MHSSILPMVAHACENPELPILKAEKPGLPHTQHKRLAVEVVEDAT